MWGGNDGKCENIAIFSGDALDTKQSPWVKLKW